MNPTTHVPDTYFSKYWKYCRGLRYMNPSAFSTIIIVIRRLLVHSSQVWNFIPGTHHHHKRNTFIRTDFSPPEDSSKYSHYGD